MLHFFDVEGILVRRWVPGQRRVAMESWTGDGWRVFPDIDSVSRHGVRLTRDEALALLKKIRERSGLTEPLSDGEAETALSSRQRRA
ncbi:MAG TPA: hypothetical protein VFI56_09235 [Vicinamibacterales bacterium]|jgi:hypothetical protein|nr:hypothetical protein [Vicinamibacterales bacterium]